MRKEYFHKLVLFMEIFLYVDSNVCGTDITVLVGYYDENEENNITVSELV